MEIKILEMVLGQIPEAIYFSLFMIFTKQLKEKRILFILLMIIEYLIIQKLIHFDIWLQIIYTFSVFIILKVLYKEKAQITDIFTFTLSSILMIIIDIPLYFIIHLITDNFIIYVLIARIMLFGTLIVLRNKLPKIQSLYKKLWNRNDSKDKKIKTTTFRSLNVVIFNITFYIINLVMLYAIYVNSLN